jgi:hypothetical protein
MFFFFFFSGIEWNCEILLFTFCLSWFTFSQIHWCASTCTSSCYIKLEKILMDIDPTRRHSHAAVLQTSSASLRQSIDPNRLSFTLHSDSPLISPLLWNSISIARSASIAKVLLFLIERFYGI